MSQSIIRESDKYEMIEIEKTNHSSIVYYDEANINIFMQFEKKYRTGILSTTMF